MAEPGDPRSADDATGDLPEEGRDDHDDLVGFSSAASLRGRARDPEPGPEPEPEPELYPEPDPEPETDLFEAPAPRFARPAAAESIFEPSPEFTGRSRRRTVEVEDPPGGGLGLYAVYALILFAVPTVGVSAVIGLIAVTGRPGPEDPLSRSHYIYQQRTLWAAAVTAAAGVILLAAPFALGVPLLFLLALWTVIRGASGVWNLKSGRAIPDPRSWWI